VLNSITSGQSDAEFNASASTVLVMDGIGSTSRAATNGINTTLDTDNSCTSPGTNKTAIMPNNGTNSNFASNRHLEGANFAFADGHVKWEKSAALGKNGMASVYNCGTTTDDKPGFPTFSLQ